jgi:hypothetical protein
MFLMEGEEMKIDLVFLVAVSLCILSFTTLWVFRKTKSVTTTFLVGFAYPFFFVSWAVIWHTTNKSPLPSIMDEVMFAFVSAVMIYLVMIVGVKLLSIGLSWVKAQIPRLKNSKLFIS